MEVPVMVLRGGSTRVVTDDKPVESGLFEVYREEFDGIWADSRPVS
jgi:hypothetical protein